MVVVANILKLIKTKMDQCVNKGYRIYLKNQNGVIVILLCGGDKSTQKADIEKAKSLAKELGV